MMFVIRKALEDAAQWDLLGHENGGSWRKEPTKNRTYGRQDTPSKGKVWHVTPHDHPDNARAAYVINTLGRAVLNAPQSKLVRNGAEGKLALARLPVPATHKEQALDEKLTSSRQHKQALPFHAFVGAGPEDFQHFSAGEGGPMSIVSRGTGLHVGAQGPGKEFDAAHDINELAKHPDAKTDPDIRAGVKRIMNMSPAQIERAVGAAGFHPEVADELVTNLKHRQQLLGQHMGAGAFGGGSKDNEKFLDRSREEDLFAGAPPQIKNLPPGKRERALAALKTELGDLVKHGWEGRNWYKESADKFKAVAGGNMEDVQKMAALHAIFSPQQAPAANTESAIRAYLHYKMGRPRDQLRGGHTDEQEEKARALLYDDHWHGGIKTNAFYRNLMTELSGEGDKVPDPARGDLQHTTNDIWVGRAFHYPTAGEGGAQGTSGFTQAQHRFMTRVQNEVAQKYGISAHRAQAALWVAAKGQSLGSMEAGAESFKHGVESAQGHVISSLAPHPESNMLPGFENLSAAAKQELHHRVLDALHDDQGRFLPTHLAGYGSEPAEAIGPNGLFKFSALTSRNLGPTVSQEKQADELLALAKKRGGTKEEKGAALQKFVEAKAGIDRATARRKYVQGPVIHQVRGIASLLAHLTGQKHVDVQRPVPRAPTNIGEQNAVHVKTDVPFKNAELAKFAKVLHREIGGAGEHVTPVPYEHGVYAVNRHGVPNEVFHKAAKRAAIETLGLSANPKDVDKLQGALFEDKSRPDVKFDRFFAHATRASNDYKEFPNGEAHRSRADAALGPTLSRRILRELAPKLRGVYEGFAKKHKLKLNLPEAYRLVEAQAKEEHRESHKKVSGRIAASMVGHDREVTTVLVKAATREDALRQVKALRNSSGRTEPEAATAHKIASRLMERHRIAEHEIGSAAQGIHATKEDRVKRYRDMAARMRRERDQRRANPESMETRKERHRAWHEANRAQTIHDAPIGSRTPGDCPYCSAMERERTTKSAALAKSIFDTRNVRAPVFTHQNPYFAKRAVKDTSTGTVHPTQGSEYFHHDVIKRLGGNLEDKKYEHGFITHGGGEYMNQSQLDSHIERHEAVNGPARPGTKVPFSGNTPAVAPKSRLAMFRSALGNALPAAVTVLRKAGRRLRNNPEAFSVKPYFRSRAIRVAGGPVEEGKHHTDTHENIENRSPAFHTLWKKDMTEAVHKTEHGFVDHEGDYYSQHHADALVDNHVKQHGTLSKHDQPVVWSRREVQEAHRTMHTRSREADEQLKRFKKVEKSARAHDHHRSACERCKEIYMNCRCSFPGKQTIVEGLCHDCEGLDKSAHKLHYRTTFAGMPISIENRKGSYRYWYDPHNKTEGKTLMHYAYGYIRRTEAADGDSVDCYIGPNENAPDVYVVRQMKTPLFEKYDEDKVMLGFDSYEDAKRAYLKQYNDPRFFGSMVAMPLGVFRQKVAKTFDDPGMVKSGFWLAKAGRGEMGYVKRPQGMRSGCPGCGTPSYGLRAMHHPDPKMQKFSCPKCNTSFHTDAAEPSASLERSEGAERPEGAEGAEGSESGYHPGVMQHLSFKKRKPAAGQRGPSTRGHIPLGMGASDRYDEYMHDQHMRSIKSKRLLTMEILMKSFGGRYAKAPALRVGPDSEHTSIHVGEPGRSHADVYEKLPEHEQEHKFVESGFIGHDDKYYSRHHMKHLVAAAEGRHPNELIRPDSLHIAPKSYEHETFTEAHHARAHATMEEARKDAESVAAQHAVAAAAYKKQREGVG